MNAVVERFQLGGLVDDVLGAGDLAAVMQPGPQAELVALGVGHGDVGKRAVFGCTHAVHECFGQLGHPLAVATGVGALGVDGVGQQADDGVQQLLLAFDQAAGSMATDSVPDSFSTKARKCASSCVWSAM